VGSFGSTVRLQQRMSGRAPSTMLYDCFGREKETSIQHCLMAVLVLESN
jgi:hypothetical protein